MPRMTLSEQVASLQSQLASAISERDSWRQHADATEGQLKRCSLELQELRPLAAKVEELTKERDRYKGYYESNDRDLTKIRQESEQLHMILDAVEGAPSRYVDAPENSYRSKDERALATRLAGTFLALSRTFAKG